MLEWNPASDPLQGAAVYLKGSCVNNLGKATLRGNRITTTIPRDLPQECTGTGEMYVGDTPNPDVRASRCVGAAACTIALGLSPKVTVSVAR